MWSQYDEDLSQNTFFKTMKEGYDDFLKKSSQEKWIICVPKNGSYSLKNISVNTILDHILVQESDGTYSTLSKRTISLKDHYLKYDSLFYIDVEVLFEETHYIEAENKYKVWCIERPLFAAQNVAQQSNNNASLVTMQDCMDFLYTETFGYNILGLIQNLCIEFWQGKDDSFLSDNLQSQKDLVGKLYSQCLQLCFKSDILCEKFNRDNVFFKNLKVAVETYMQYCLGEKLMYSINSLHHFSDSVLNKIVRNSSNISFADLNISSKLEDEIGSAKQELCRINNINTALDKMNCLTKTFNTFSKSVRLREMNICLTSDDFIQIFVYLILKCNIPNWIANLTFVKEFNFISVGISDQNSFLLANLEGAIEFINSSHFFNIKKANLVNYIEEQGSNSNKLFYCLYTKLKTDKCKEDLSNLVNLEFNKYFKAMNFCHPLCLCKNCVQNVSGVYDQKTYNIVNEYNQNFIILSCIENNIDLIEILLTLDLDINCRDQSGKTALHYAAENGYQDILILLVNYGADVNVVDNNKNTPLHFAADRGHENCIKGLIYSSSLVELNLQNISGETPMFLAARWGFVDIVKVLLENGSSVCVKNNRKMSVFKLSPNYFITNLFKEFGVIQSNDILKEVKNCNNSGKNVPSVMDEVHSRNVKARDVLHGVKPKNEAELKTINLILKAIENNDFPLTCYYLGYNGNVLELPEDVLKNKCHPLCNCKSCCEEDNTDVVDCKYMKPKANCKMNVNIVNNDGFTCLHIAAKFGRTEILRILLDSGASTNLYTYEHFYTPLHLACMFQRVSTVRELLKCGDCNIEAIDFKGNTALFYAAVQNNNLKLVEMLLQSTADCQRCNFSGKSILTACKEKNLFRISTLLKEYQGNVSIRRKKCIAVANGDVETDDFVLI